LTVPVLAVTLVYAGIEMDMFDQVDEILERAGVDGGQIRFDRQQLVTLVLRDLVIRYRKLVKNREWEPANECLLAISRMVVVLLAE
jgi:hypothetical protein